MTGSIDENFAAKIKAACRQTAARVVRVASQTGTSIIVWDDERAEVREISPAEAEQQLSAARSDRSSG